MHIDIAVMNLFSFYLGFVALIVSYFLGILFGTYYFSHFNTGLIAGLNTKRTIAYENSQNTMRHHSWKKVSFFENSNPTLYYFTENHNLLASVQKEKGDSFFFKILIKKNLQPNWEILFLKD